MRYLLLLILFAAPLQAQMSEAEKAKTLEYIASLYDAESGGYKVDAKGKPMLRATSGAVRSYIYLGREIPNREKTATFLRNQYESQTGAFREVGGEPNVTITAVALLAVNDLNVKSEDRWNKSLVFLKANVKGFEDVRLGAAALESIKARPEWLDDWIKLADAQLNNDGTAGKGDGKARDTASVIAMKLRLGYPIANKAKVIEAILDGQRPDGGWGKADAKTSDLETTYRVMRCLMLLKEKPKDTKKLNAFLVSCRNTDGGYSVDPGQPSTMSGVYYASAINKWMTK